jgi:hypothetical protein
MYDKLTVGSIAGSDLNAALTATPGDYFKPSTSQSLERAFVHSATSAPAYRATGMVGPGLPLSLV